VRSEAKALLRIVPLAALLAILALGLISTPALAVTDHVLTDSFGSPGSGAGQLNDPQGIAIDEGTGDVYVADTGNRRVSKFDADGDFLFSWGIDVVKSGPGNSGASEHQSVTVQGSGGTFTLRAPNGFDDSFNDHQSALVAGTGGSFFLTVPNGFNQSAPAQWTVMPGPNSTFFIQVDASEIDDSVTPDIPHNATAAELQAAIETLSFGDIKFEDIVASVSGPVAGPWEVIFNVNPPNPTATVAGNGGTVVQGKATDPIGRNASATEVQAALEALSTLGPGNVAVSGAAGGPWDIEFKGIFATQDLPSLGADGSDLTGSEASAKVLAGQISTPIGRNASATEVQAALEALSTLGPGNVAVSGAAGGPWDIEFKGIYAHNDVPELIGDAAGLSGEPKSVTVATTTEGGGPEVCKAGLDICKAGVPGGLGGPPQFNAPVHLAVDNSGGPSDGAVYMGDNGGSTISFPGLVEKFDPNGAFIAANDGSASGGFPIKGHFNGIAVDGSGNLYLGGSPITKFTESGSYLGKLDKGGNDVGMAVEPSGQHIFFNFVAGGLGVIKYNPLTNKFFTVGSSPSGVGNSATNLALDPSNNNLYVSFKGHVKKYDPSQNTTNLLEEFGAGDLIDARALAVKVDDFQTTYVADAGTDEIQVFASPILPEPKTGEITGLGTTSATLHGTVDPNGVKASYQFEYVTESAFETSGFSSASKAPVPAGDAGEGDGEIDVSEGIGGLEPGTTYRWRLAGANALASAVGATKSFTTPSPVEISDLFPSNVGTIGATVNATIDPGGAKTTYRVEYGMSEAYGEVAPVPDASAGSGTAELKVSQALQGLEPDTTYHFRFGAENVGGPVLSEDATFHTFPVEAPSLPDGRAWEMVSPPAKNGGSVGTHQEFTRVADDGDAIVFPSLTSFADSLGTNGNGNEYISKRSADGWNTHGITPLQIPSEFPFFSSGFIGEFSADLDRGVFLATSTLEPGHPNVESTWNLYGASNLLTPQGASMQLLSDSVNPTVPLQGNSIQEFNLAAASRDLSHVVFEGRNALTADSLAADPTLPKLYESVNGVVRLVGILPDDACGSPPCIAPGSIAGRGAMENSVDGKTYTTHTISEDGSRVFFTAPPYSKGVGPSGRGPFGTLYVREGGTTTTPLNVSERTDCNADPSCGGDEIPDLQPAPSRPAKFLDATSDGAFVLSVTDEQLNDEDTNSGYDVYRYEIDAPAGERLTLISKDENPAATGSAGGYVVGTSEDGSYVYFTGANELVPDQPTAVELGSGEMLFAWHEGEVRFVGVGPRASSWGNDAVLGGGAGGGALPVNFKAATVTPDGKHLVFPSISSWLADAAAGFDNSGRKECGFGVEAERCQQIFAYDFEADELQCASCAPSLEQPSGDAWPIQFADNSASGLSSQHITRTISDDGRWVFFSSPDRLAFRDTNGRYDAYRYDTTTGRVALLSSGTCNCDSYFVESSPDGEDAFFTTRERLVAIDFDANADLYDARVGGGIAAQNVVPTPQCEGDACIPPVAVPNFPTPASAGFKGQGNVRPEPSGRCRAGKVRRGKRCVSKRSLARRVCKKRNGEARRRCLQARVNRNRGGAK
jgi:NHL repeat-containing protein